MRRANSIDDDTPSSSHLATQAPRGGRIKVKLVIFIPCNKYDYIPPAPLLGVAVILAPAPIPARRGVMLLGPESRGVRAIAVALRDSSCRSRSSLMFGDQLVFGRDEDTEATHCSL